MTADLRNKVMYKRPVCLQGRFQGETVLNTQTNVFLVPKFTFIPTHKIPTDDGFELEKNLIFSNGFENGIFSKTL